MLAENDCGDRSPSGMERRRHARERVDYRCQIVMGPDALVFCRTVDLSEGGACLKLPRPFALAPGEQFLVEGPGPLGGGRRARVVGLSDAGCHCAFVDASARPSRSRERPVLVR